MNKIFVDDVNTYLSLSGRRAVDVGEISELLQSDADRLNTEIVARFGNHELAARPGGRASTIVMNWAVDVDLARGKEREALLARVKKAEESLKLSLEFIKSI